MRDLTTPNDMKLYAALGFEQKGFYYGHTNESKLHAGEICAHARHAMNPRGKLVDLLSDALRVRRDAVGRNAFKRERGRFAPREQLAEKRYEGLHDEQMFV